MIIRVNSLKEGYQEYSSPVDLVEVDIVEKEFSFPVSITLQIEKFKSQINVHGILHTKLDLICDRCLEHFEMKIDPEFDVIFKVSTHRRHNVEDEVRVIYPFENELDIAQDIKDALILSIPMKKLCHENCRGICPGCGANLNYEECRCNFQRIDPRWEVLKALTTK